LYAFCGNDGINRWDYLGQLSLKGFLKKAWKPLLAIGAGVLTAGTAMYAYALATGGAGAATFGGMLSSVGLASGWGPAWASVAGGGFGFGSSFAGARLSGAGTSDALKAGLRGAVTGATVAYTVSQVVAGVDAWRHDTHQFYLVDPAGGNEIDTMVRRMNRDEIRGSVRIFENGILNDLERSVANGLNHYDGKPFILAHNPTHGALADIIETALGKITGASSLGHDLAGVVQQIDTATSSLYLHSQGAQIGINALRSLAEAGGQAPGLSVFGYGGATHLTTSRAVVASAGARWAGWTINALDAVPNIVGLNAVFAPHRFLTSLLASPLLLAPAGWERLSPHTWHDGIWKVFNHVY
jgi:hypothetical protein